MQERRAQTRMLCADLIEVRWEDEHHRWRRSTALLEDISRAGACLQLEIPVPPGVSMRMFCGPQRLDGTVRYCVYREIGYLVGLEFDAGSEWTQVGFEPQHLLDPARLPRREGGRSARRLN